MRPSSVGTPVISSIARSTASVLTAMHEWTGVSAVASTTSLSVQERTVTARVVAADRGDVAGTVTFTGQAATSALVRASAWSVQVLVSRGGASVVVPAGIRTVTAQYDGYRDQLVQVSNSDAVTLADVVVTPDPEPSPVPTDGTSQSGTGQTGTGQSDPGAASLATSGQSPVLITAASMLAALLLVAGAVLLIGRRRIRNG